jgi:hypothetical protein
LLLPIVAKVVACIIAVDIIIGIMRSGTGGGNNDDIATSCFLELRKKCDNGDEGSGSKWGGLNW